MKIFITKDDQVDKNPRPILTRIKNLFSFGFDIPSILSVIKSIFNSSLYNFGHNPQDCETNNLFFFSYSLVNPENVLTNIELRLSLFVNMSIQINAMPCRFIGNFPHYFRLGSYTELKQSDLKAIGWKSWVSVDFGVIHSCWSLNVLGVISDIPHAWKPHCYFSNCWDSIWTFEEVGYCLFQLTLHAMATDYLQWCLGWRFQSTLKVQVFNHQNFIDNMNDVRCHSIIELFSFHCVLDWTVNEHTGSCSRAM